MSVCVSGPHTCMGAAYCLISHSSCFRLFQPKTRWMSFLSSFFFVKECVVCLRVLQFPLLHSKGRGSLGEWNFKSPWSAGRGRRSVQNFLLLILESSMVCSVQDQGCDEPDGPHGPHQRIKCFQHRQPSVLSEA